MPTASASSATLEYEGQPVNHQWSKGLEFETAFRDVLIAIARSARTTTQTKET